MAHEAATGLVVRNGRIEWTVLRRTRNGFNRADQGVLPFEEQAAGLSSLLDVTDENRPAVETALRTALKNRQGILGAAVGSGQALLRVAELPAVDPDELKGMVDLQVDKVSPFPPDSTVTSFEVVQQSETASGVLMAALDRKTADSIGRTLTGAGLIPDRLDVETLGWWRLLLAAGAVSPTGCQFLLLLDQPGCDFVVTREGIPVLFRSPGLTAELPAADLVNELDYTLTTIESEFGIAAVDSIAVWHWSDAPAELVGLLTAHGSAMVEARSFESLPPLSEGLALRALDGEPAALNLAIDEWGAGRRRKTVRRNLLLASAAVGVVWLLAVGGALSAIQIQKRMQAGLESRATEMERPARQARASHTLLLTAEQYTDRSRSALECLRLACVAKPGEVEFQQFKYDNEKDRQVVVRGEASQPGAVYDFENGLSKAALFSSVKLDGPRTVQNKYQFTVTLKLPRKPGESP